MEILVLSETFSVDTCKFNLSTSDLEGFKKPVFCIFNKHFIPFVSFYTPRRDRKNYGFLMFSGGIKKTSGTKLIKRKYISGNEAPFMTEELHKAIMKRSNKNKT